MFASYCSHLLRFAFPAKTSRNTLYEKKSWFIKITDLSSGISGIGECSFIEGLSIDNPFLIENTVKEICQQINNGKKEFDLFSSFPAIAFGLETAFNDLKNGGKQQIFDSKFFKGEMSIPINGLVWMGNFEEMNKQIAQKINDGFDCIKIKIAAFEFEDEIRFLKKIRAEYGDDFQLRLDANGAYSPDNALEYLKKLSDLNVHSIEQPIKQGQWDKMAELCLKSPIPIALDEELIGCDSQKQMLKHIKPAFIVLKPSLLGGFDACDYWISLASDLGINWWATSALESNIGLNAIAQWVSCKTNLIHQGLGTGKIYTNNIDSPLTVENGNLYFSTMNEWNLNKLIF